ncbi:hypothetical protein F4810DRAFT_682597 [Camillea tinctor]|nr:hypothetical protein F4810DRAFT_682597 [Camillea tinctor]
MTGTMTRPSRNHSGLLELSVELLRMVASHLLPGELTNLAHTCRGLYVAFGVESLVVQDAQFQRRWIEMRRETGLDHRFNELFDGLEDDFENMTIDEIKEVVLERRFDFEYTNTRARLKVRPFLHRAIEAKVDIKTLTMIFKVYDEHFPEALDRGLMPMYAPTLGVIVGSGNVDALKMLIQRNIDLDLCPYGDYAYCEPETKRHYELAEYEPSDTPSHSLPCNCYRYGGYPLKDLYWNDQHCIFWRAYAYNHMELARFVLFELRMAVRINLWYVAGHQESWDILRYALINDEPSDSYTDNHALRVALRCAAEMGNDDNLKNIGLLVEAITNVAMTDSHYYSGTRRAG